MAGLIRGNLHPAGAEHQRFVFELRTDPLRSEGGGFFLPPSERRGIEGDGLSVAHIPPPLRGDPLRGRFLPPFGTRSGFTPSGHFAVDGTLTSTSRQGFDFACT
jgi:hypothetical protein